MLEKTPAPLGHALSALRAGVTHMTWSRDSAVGPETVTVRSDAFEDGGALPPKFTEDGEKISPDLSWSNVPEDAQTLILVVEDIDSPTPLPIIHTLAARPAMRSGRLAEGELAPGSGDWLLGKNSFGKLGWLPPDPPKGHGDHHYVFQLFALSSTPDLQEGWGKNDLIAALENSVLARGRLEGIYGRK